MSSFTDLQALLGAENIAEDYPLGDKTTFRAGGKCRLFLEPAHASQIPEILRLLKAEGIPFFIVGRGSNLLVSDSGFPGAVLSLRKHFSGISVHGTELMAGGGALLPDIAKEALSHGLTGLEFASGIPGTLGGAVRMNAGAYGGEIAQIAKEVTLLMPSGAIRKVPGTEMGFSYRHSIVEETGAVVLEAVLSLASGDPAVIRGTMDDLNRKRREKQPLEYGSAGSAFKRPEGYYAGALIEQAGLRGYRSGQAGVSMKHAGFVINYGGASASEIYEVLCLVQRTVREKFGVELEREVLLLGEF